jgi:hypothetical protein
VASMSIPVPHSDDSNEDEAVHELLPDEESETDINYFEEIEQRTSLRIRPNAPLFTNRLIDRLCLHEIASHHDSEFFKLDSLCFDSKKG